MTDLSQSDSPPTRGLSRVIELEARIEAQIERWDAELDAAHVAPTDKARTLLAYVREELRGRDRQRTEGVVMGRCPSHFLCFIKASDEKKLITARGAESSS